MKKENLIMDIVLKLGNLAEYELCLNEARKVNSDLRNCKYDIKFIKSLYRVKSLEELDRMLVLMNSVVDCLKEYIYDQLDEDFLDNVDIELGGTFLERMNVDVFYKTHKLLSKFTELVRPLNITGKYCIQYERLGHFIVYMSNNMKETESFGEKLGCCTLCSLEYNDIGCICNY